MNRAPVKASIAAAIIAMSGCAALQVDPLRLERENAELRRMLVETRREIEELKRDQERLRAAVEYLQYGRVAARPGADGIVAGSTGGYQSPTRTWPAGRWPGGPVPGQAAQEPGPAARAGQGIEARVVTETPAPGVEATITTSTPGAGPIASATSTPDLAGGRTNATASGENPNAAVVMGVREGGEWGEPGVVPEPEIPPVPPQLEGTLYADGLKAMAAERYDEAIQFFRDFIHLDSSSPLADDAQFWIAECYRRKGMDTAAIKEFNQVVLRYGSGDRGPAALLQLAAIFSKIGDQVDARLSLQKLINRYPRSAEAGRARAWLHQMGG
ncbi:MAG: hypothetical protein D6815_01620 [Candidatus Dadabacteria bacterium]|nr:MAG: hypothetical protein D6815_01620 [Candidatus Dadabacteria bacterium]